MGKEDEYVDAVNRILTLAIQGHVSKQLQDAGGSVPQEDFFKLTGKATDEVTGLLRVLEIIG